ncbi:hypothetical protein ACFLTX_02985 [Chloroflexota bacterium]
MNKNKKGKMEIHGYGEDALTLWALKHKLSTILEELNDKSSLSECKALFRPSFGRRGGEKSAQFGEFDFILFSKEHLYLGESKWHRSSENFSNGIFNLREEQILRHKIFRFYVEEWAFGKKTSWHEFINIASSKLLAQGINKPIAPDDSLLTTNLKTAMNLINQHFEIIPSIRNVLLYLYYGANPHILPQRADKEFKIVNIDCSEGLTDNFVLL